MSYIEIKIKGYTHCTLIGKAVIAQTLIDIDTSGTHYVSIIVDAITLVKRRHESLKIKVQHIKTSRQINQCGYLVYFKTNTAGWIELVPLDDPRFSGYDNQLIELEDADKDNNVHLITCALCTLSYVHNHKARELKHDPDCPNYKCCLTCDNWKIVSTTESYCNSEEFNSSVYDSIKITKPETFFCSYYSLKDK